MTGTTVLRPAYAALVPHYVDSEVGQLGTVLLHRPGPELSRVTPRTSGSLLFGGIPWAARAQEEHDAFADALQANGVEVLYLRQLLIETLAIAEARAELVDAAVADPRLGDTLRLRVRDHLAYLDQAALADVLIAGLAREELRTGWNRPTGLVYRLMDPQDYIVRPLPNLVLIRDSSVWIRDRVAVAALPMPARRRETRITSAIYRHHPRFGGTRLLYQPDFEALAGGDVLLLTPGVIAIGVGGSTTPAAAERLARRIFTADLAHTVLVVPITQMNPTVHLDTVCTMVDVDTALMHPGVADSLVAYTVIAGDHGELRVDGPAPFLHAAADAMDLDTLRVIGTGLDPVTGGREQWDDGHNTLVIAPRLCVAYERNVETNAQLERAGIEVIPIPGSELSSVRGGPRCMSCPLLREAR